MFELVRTLDYDGIVQYNIFLAFVEEQLLVIMSLCTRSVDIAWGRIQKSGWVGAWWQNRDIYIFFFFLGGGGKCVLWGGCKNKFRAKRMIYAHRNVLPSPRNVLIWEGALHFCLFFLFSNFFLNLFSFSPFLFTSFKIMGGGGGIARQKLGGGGGALCPQGPFSKGDGEIL